MAKFESLERLRPIETSAQQVSELSSTTEESLVESVFQLHEQVAEEVLRWTANRTEVSTSEAIDLGVRVSAIWKDFAYGLTKIPHARVDEILHRRGYKR